MNQDQLLASIDWCLAQLKAEQNPDGSFTSTTREFARGTLVASHNRRTTFYSAAITLALEQSSASLATEIKNQAVSFLLHEAGPNYEYRYWTHDQTHLPSYPPDLDDTLLAIAAIHSVDERLITGRCLAWLLRHLIAGEKKPGGPYRTWLFSPTKQDVWHDIDGVVNANIYYALTRLGINAPQLAEFCHTLVQEQRWHSPYYIGIWPTLYSLSRLNIWKDMQTNWLAIWQDYIHSPNDTLSQALILSSALRTGYTDTGALRKLAAKVMRACADANDTLENCAYIMERHGADTTELSGARGWTLAAMVESLELFKEKFYPQPKILTESISEQLYQQVTARTYERFSNLPETLRLPALQAVQNIITIDKRQEIGLAAYYANEYLNAPLAKRITEELGYLNMLGWLAYQIYDDWLDEGKSHSPLTIAQIAWREVGGSFTSLCRGQIPLHNWVKSLLDEVDIANGLDYATNRLPQYTDGITLPAPLPEVQNMTYCKSIGHALGVGIVFALGTQARENTLEGITQFFRHYLTAKQLCDDIHDWEQDLIALRITPVIQLVLAQYKLEHPETESIKLAQDLTQLRQIFWNHSMPILLANASDHCTQAASWCRDLPWQTKPTFFLNGLQQVQNAIQRCRSEFFKTTEFINTYAAITA